MNLPAETPVSTKASWGDVFRITALTTTIYTRWKRNPDGAEAAPTEEEVKQLQDLGTKLGFKVDILAYANELLNGLDSLAPYRGKLKPEQAAVKFYKKSPNIAHILASDPNGGWKAIGFFLGEANNKEKVWIKEVYIAVVKYVKHLKKKGLVPDNPFDPVTPVSADQTDASHSHSSAEEPEPSTA